MHCMLETSFSKPTCTCISRCLVVCPCISRCLVVCPCISRCLVVCPCISGCLVVCPCISGCLVVCPCISGCLVVCPCISTGLANPRLPSRMRLFAWFHAALTFISKFVFVFFLMCVFASLEFNTVFSSNAHVREMKIPQSSPVGARSFE